MVELYNPDMYLRVQLYKERFTIFHFQNKQKTAKTYLCYGTAHVHHKLAIFKSSSFKISRIPTYKEGVQSKSWTLIKTFQMHLYKNITRFINLR